MTLSHAHPARFRFADVVISSSESLTPLVGTTGPADLGYRVALGIPPPAGGLVRVYSMDGSDWLRLHEGDGLTSYVFPRLATFTFEARSGQILGYPDGSTEPHTMRHLLLDQVLPLHLVAQGRHVLHASAVTIGAGTTRRALVFLGSSGAGKSSTATGCALAGAPLLADDFTLITHVAGAACVVPANMGIRLWDDVVTSVGHRVLPQPVAEYTSKKRIAIDDAGDPDGSAHEPVPIGALVCLGSRVPPDRGIDLEPVSAADALMQVVEHSYRIDMTSVAANERMLELAATLVETVPVVRVGLPDDLESLQSTCRSLLDVLGERVLP